MIKIVRIFILIIILVVSIQYNVFKNSVYYAKNMPHSETTEPQIVMLVDNAILLHGVGNISSEIEISDKGFIYNGENSISAADHGYLYKTDKITYKFNSNFSKIEWALDNDYKHVDLKNISEKDIKRDILENFTPLLDMHTEPTINLQWIFDWQYKATFN
ncbi:MAG: hypothetical protein Q3988_06080 [Gemella sp.]|nr:hypothetical protein [Gemella sp.]